MLTAHIMSTTLGYAGAVTVPPPIPPRVVYTGLTPPPGTISAATGDELADVKPLYYPTTGVSVATNKRTKERGFVPNNFFEKQGEQFVHTDPYNMSNTTSTNPSSLQKVWPPDDPVTEELIHMRGNTDHAGGPYPQPNSELAHKVLREAFGDLLNTHNTIALHDVWRFVTKSYRGADENRDNGKTLAGDFHQDGPHEDIPLLVSIKYPPFPWLGEVETLEPTLVKGLAPSGPIKTANVVATMIENWNTLHAVPPYIENTGDTLIVRAALGTVCNSARVAAAAGARRAFCGREATSPVWPPRAAPGAAKDYCRPKGRGLATR